MVVNAARNAINSSPSRIKLTLQYFGNYGSLMLFYKVNSFSGESIPLEEKTATPESGNCESGKQIV